MKDKLSDIKAGQYSLKDGQASFTDYLVCQSTTPDSSPCLIDQADQWWLGDELGDKEV